MSKAGTESYAMKIESPFATNSIGLLATAAIRRWMSTLDHKWAFYDPAVDPGSPECSSPRIYVFWHEYLLAPLYLRGHCNVTMLLSRHRDAEYLARIARHMGFGCVRGSTNQGAATALRQLVRQSKQNHLTVTPDGPLGPRREMAPGSVFLASKLGLPLVVFGVGYDRPWRLKTWDRFAISRVGTRSRVIVSPAMAIPPDLDRDGIEHYRLRVEQLLHRLTIEAEAWAEAGTAKREEMPIRHVTVPPLDPTRRRPARSQYVRLESLTY
jgi:lysophospholipid acyltransferase (LPLAT)-like uncharacterized protein